jgi:hypothetical protein
MRTPILVAVLAIATPALAGDADPAELRPWIGRYPYEKIDGRPILAVPELAARLQAAVGDDAMAAIPAMTVSGTVIEERGWLVIAGCLPHQCDTQHYAVAVDLGTYAVRACMRFGSFDQQTEIHGGTDIPRTQRQLTVRDMDS